MASWNVLSLNRAGALKELRNVLQRYSISVAALQEIRWKGSNIMDFKEATLFLSGGDRHEFGTGFIVTKPMKQNVIDFTPINKRLCTLRLRGKMFNITVICAHAPTEDKEEEEKDVFYENLELAWNRAPGHDVKMVLGDFNAKLGRESCFSPTIGRQSLHCETSENGVKLIDFAAGKNMVISSTYFPHKNIHKATWRSPDGVTENQIDHVLIDRRHATDILDVRSCRGADVDTDHYMVRVKYRQRLANYKKEMGDRQILYNVHCLGKNEQLRRNYQCKLDERMEIERDEMRSGNIEERWKRIRLIVENTVKETVGEKQHDRRAEWFDEECEKIINERNRAREKFLQRRTRFSDDAYKMKRREARKCLRAKKRTWENNRLKFIDEQYWRGESRDYFKGIRESRNGFKPRTNLCRSKEGDFIGGKEEILNRWKEYFEELLNPVGEEMGQDEQMESEAAEELECPSKEEILGVIKKLKNFKSPGQDGLPAELYKYGSEKLLEEIANLIQEIWYREEMPKVWCTAIICPIHKKGDNTNCNNYRGISLLDVVYKVFSKLISRKLEDTVENLLGDYQCGFRKNRSTVDQIFALRCILEKLHEFNIDIHQLFIDFRQAYDCIHRESLFSILRELGIHQKLRSLIRLTLTNSTAMVKIQNSKTEVFEIKKGLRQGDPLSTCLFNICLEYAMRKIRVNPGGTIFNRTSQFLAFADDVVLMARNQASLSECFSDLLLSSNEIGLSVNIAKTKYMINTRKKEVYQYVKNFECNRGIYERVNEFKYLGAQINDQNEMHLEIRARMAAGNRCYYALQKLLRSSYLNRKLKILVYRVIIRPIVLYGSETWTMRKCDEELLRVWERKILRRVFGAVCENGEWRIRTNREIYDSYRESDIVTEIRRRRIQWLGHVERMEQSRTTRRLLKEKPSGSRPRGRPRVRWSDQVEEDLKRLRISNWKQKAASRVEWRKVLKEVRALQGL